MVAWCGMPQQCSGGYIVCAMVQQLPAWPSWPNDPCVPNSLWQDEWVHCTGFENNLSKS